MLQPQRATIGCAPGVEPDRGLSNMMDAVEDTMNEAPQQQEPKKPYEPPQLVAYGSVKDLTQDFGSNGDDGLAGAS